MTRASAKKRKPRKSRVPELTTDQILAWADAHFARTGAWPNATSGRVIVAPREKWLNINACLRGGFSTLPRGGSLARLLAEHRGVRNIRSLPSLDEEQNLRWADAYLARQGEWP